MAIAYVGGAVSASSTTAATTKAITYSPTSGNTILVFAAGVGVTVSKITDNIDTVGTSWTKVAGPSTNTVEGSLWARTAVAGITTITVTFASSTRSNAGVVEYSGVQKFGNVNNSNTGSSASPGDTLSTQDDNNYIVVGMSREGTSTWSTRSGAGTLRENRAGGGSTTPGIGISDNTSATPASVTAGATISSSGAWCACSVELRSVSLSPISGSSSGSASVSATLQGTGALSGTATGHASASATPQGTGKLAGSSAGKASASATIGGIGKLSGMVNGQASVSGTATNLSGNLAGIIIGHATVSATIIGLTSLIGSSSGHATASATAKGSGKLTGSVSGKATLTATLKATGLLMGSVHGKAIVSGTLTPPSGQTKQEDRMHIGDIAAREEGISSSNPHLGGNEF